MTQEVGLAQEMAPGAGPAGGDRPPPAGARRDRQPARGWGRAGDARPPRADARRTREQPLAAARDVFVEQGPGAPLDEIARRAGVGIATLYRAFPGPAPLIGTM